MQGNSNPYYPTYDAATAAAEELNKNEFGWRWRALYVSRGEWIVIRGFNQFQPKAIDICKKIPTKMIENVIYLDV